MAVVVVVVRRRLMGRGRGDGDGVEQGRCERKRHSLDGGHDDGCAYFPAPGLLYSSSGWGRKIPEILDDRREWMSEENARAIRTKLHVCRAC